MTGTNINIYLALICSRNRQLFSKAMLESKIHVQKQSSDIITVQWRLESKKQSDNLIDFG